MKDEAVRLRKQGLTYAAIASRLNVSVTTAYRWTDPAHASAERERSRAWKDKHREANRESMRNAYRAKKAAVGRACSVCAQTMCHKSSGNVCFDCRKRFRAERGLQICAWWAAGLSMRQIAERLAWSKGRLCFEMDWLRRNGFDLPKRYAVVDGKRVAGHGSQVHEGQK